MFTVRTEGYIVNGVRSFESLSRTRVEVRRRRDFDLFPTLPVASRLPDLSKSQGANVPIMAKFGAQRARQENPPPSRGPGRTVVAGDERLLSGRMQPSERGGIVVELHWFGCRVADVPHASGAPRGRSDLPIVRAKCDCDNHWMSSRRICSQR